MENRFAGAQHQGERRRRRLAHDDTGVGESDLDESILAEFSSDNVLHSGHVASSQTLGMIARVVSRHLWKQVVFLVILGAALTGLIWTSLTTSPELQPIASYERDLFRSLAGLFLLLSGQLSFLIGWLRQESVIDFRGRYRWWRWMAAATVAVAVLLITNTLHVVPDALATIVEPVTGPVVAARPALVAVPCMAFCLIVLSRILPDMSRSPGSQALFVVALLTVVLRQMLVFGATIDSISSATLDAMLVSAAYFMFASSLLHCRFVAYICNDPPLANSKLSPQKPANVKQPPVQKGIPAPTSMTTQPSDDIEKLPAAEERKATSGPARKSRKKSRSAKRKAA